MSDKSNIWASGDAYEPYVGRWSRLVAREFIRWLNVPSGKRWLDIGCGTGALSQMILDLAAPHEVKGIDQSPGYVEYARKRIKHDAASFDVGDAQALLFEDAVFDTVVSGLVLNFVPDPQRMVSEMARVARSTGTVAVYVWDYAGEMQLMRHFWDAAITLDPAARRLDEGVRFPICKPEPLQQLFVAAGLAEVEVRAIDVPTHFRNFDDYWSPFLGGQGPAPSYAMSLTENRRKALRDHIQAHLPTAADGSIELIARVWAVRGQR
jgi:SAM-dependent methyltransferase